MVRRTKNAGMSRPPHLLIESQRRRRMAVAPVAPISPHVAAGVKPGLVAAASVDADVGDAAPLQHRLASHLALHRVGDEALLVRTVVKPQQFIGAGLSLAAEAHFGP
jgi:hypothetical protein